MLEGTMNSATQLEKIIEFFQKYPEISYERGDRILRPNEYNGHIYFVKEGYVKIYKILQSGQEITLNFFNLKVQKYIIFGYSDLLTQFHVEALTNVVLYRAPKSDFQELTDQYPFLKEYVIKDFNVFFEQMIAQIEWLSIPDAYTRIKAMLYSLAIYFGKNSGNKVLMNEFELKVTHQLIASFTGLSRETVTIQINRLVSEGYLSRQGNTLVIENLQKLAESVK